MSSYAKHTKRSTTIRLSDEARQELKDLAGKMRISQAAVMEIALRKLYQQEINNMTTTIETTFQRSDLPEWARNDDDIFERCLSSLSFRAEVFSAETAQRQRQIRTENRKYLEELRNR